MKTNLILSTVLIAVACLGETWQPENTTTVVVAVSTDPGGLKVEPRGIVAIHAGFGGRA